MHCLWAMCERYKLQSYFGNCYFGIFFWYSHLKLASSIGVLPWVEINQQALGLVLQLMIIPLIFLSRSTQLLRALSFVIWINRIRAQKEAMLMKNGRYDLNGGNKGGSSANAMAVRSAAVVRKAQRLGSEKDLQLNSGPTICHWTNSLTLCLLISSDKTYFVHLL